MKNSRKNQLLALLPPAAALATALVGGVALQPFPDAGDYLALAEHFNSGFELGTQVPAGWRTPGYPALLFAFGFAGKYGYLLLNMLALYFTALILLFRCEKWNIDRRIFIAFFTATAGVAALGASALSETVFVLFLVLNLELMCRRGYLPAALALAVAALIRPAAMFLWAPEAAWIIAVHGRRKWRLAILFAIASNLLVLGWSLRNLAVCNHFAYTSHSGRYACFYKMGASEAKAKKIDFENAVAEISGSVEEELQKSGGDPNDEFAVDAAATRVFMRYAAHHPGQLAGALLTDLPNFWLPDITPLFERLGVSTGNRGTLSVLRNSGLRAALEHYFEGVAPMWKVVAVAYCALYALVLTAFAAGVCKLASRRRKLALWALGLLLGYFWLLPAGNLDWRFRMAIQPVILLTAAYGATRHRAVGSARRPDASN